MEKVIKYEKKKINYNLVFGLIWLAVFFLNYLNKRFLIWFDYLWLILSLLYISLSIYQLIKQYGKINNDVLIINKPFLKSKRINFKNVISVRKIANLYIFKTTNDEFKIKTDFIDSRSLKVLDKVIDSYKLN